MNSLADVHSDVNLSSKMIIDIDDEDDPNSRNINVKSLHQRRHHPVSIRHSSGGQSDDIPSPSLSTTSSSCSPPLMLPSPSPLHIDVSADASSVPVVHGTSSCGRSPPPAWSSRYTQQPAVTLNLPDLIETIQEDQVFEDMTLPPTLVISESDGGVKDLSHMEEFVGSSTDSHRPRAGSASAHYNKRQVYQRHRQNSGDTGFDGSVNSLPTRADSGARVSVTPTSDRKFPSLLMDAFRPRSKSDTKNLKRPGAAHRGGKLSGSALLEAPLTYPTDRPINDEVKIHPGKRSGDDYLLSPPPGAGGSATYLRNSGSGEFRVRSGSDSSRLRNPVSQMMDRIRNRTSSDARHLRKRHMSGPQPERHLSAGSPLPGYGKMKSPAEHRRTMSEEATLDGRYYLFTRESSRNSNLQNIDGIMERMEIEDLTKHDEEIFVKFMKAHKCYDLIPTSSKLVVFDTHLLVKKAFFALVYNGVRAAPVWDSDVNDFVGILTITDFIAILNKHYKSPLMKVEEIEQHTIQTWRLELADKLKPLIFIKPDESLFHAIEVLCATKVHRLPIIDPETGNCLHILTHKRILKFLFLYMHELPKPSFFEETISSLRIGTYENVETVTQETPLLVALQKFLTRRVSALPVVDDQGRCVDVYAKFDVINLAAEKTYNNLDIPVRQALEYRNKHRTTPTQIHRCLRSEKMGDVLRRLVIAEVHRLIVCDESEKIIGVLSLSDVLSFLVLKPAGVCERCSMRDEKCCPLRGNTEKSIVAAS